MSHVNLDAAIETYRSVLTVPEASHAEVAVAVADLIGVAERVLSAELIAATTQPQREPTWRRRRRCRA